MLRQPLEGFITVTGLQAAYTYPSIYAPGFRESCHDLSNAEKNVSARRGRLQLPAENFRSAA